MYFDLNIIIIIINYSYTVGLLPEPVGYAVLLPFQTMQKTVPLGRMRNCMLVLSCLFVLLVLS